MRRDEGFIPLIAIIGLVLIVAVIVLAMFFPGYVIGAVLLVAGLMLMVPGISPFPDPRIGLAVLIAGVVFLMMGYFGIMDGIWSFAIPAVA
jgi:hypothetical protein